MGIVNLNVDGFISSCKVGKKASYLGSFWKQDIAKGSFLSVRGENSSRRENNLTIPNRFLKLSRACYTKQNNLEDIPSLALW